MSYSDRNPLPRLLSQYQFHHINIHAAKRWFSHVRSSFTWFLLQKSDNKNSFLIENNYVIQDRVKVSLSKGMDFIPLYYSNAVKSILEKTICMKVERYAIETSSDLHRHTRSHLFSTQKKGPFEYRIIHTPTQQVYTSRPHKYQKGYKAFLSLSNQYKTFVDNCGMTQSVASYDARIKKKQNVFPKN